jgi:type IV fimbrial biogenesis protein FimT
MFAAMGSMAKGFTLVEMLVTVSILSTLLSVGIPSFRALIVQNRLSAQSNDFITTLALARNEALKRSASVTACRSANPQADDPSCTSGGSDGWKNGWIVFVETEGGAVGTRQAGEPVIASHAALAANNRMSGTNNVVNRVTFGTQGMTTGPGTWTLVDGTQADKGRCIVVARTGRVTVAEMPASGDCQSDD